MTCLENLSIQISELTMLTPFAYNLILWKYQAEGKKFSVNENESSTKSGLRAKKVFPIKVV